MYATGPSHTEFLSHSEFQIVSAQSLLTLVHAKGLRSADARAVGIFREPSKRDDKVGVLGGHSSGPPRFAAHTDCLAWK